MRLLQAGLTLMVSLALASSAAASAHSEELARRSFLGIVFDLQDQSGPGLRVQRALPGSTAAETGLVTNDRLTRVGDMRIRMFNDVLVALKAADTGAPIDLEWLRGDELLSATTRLGGLPMETIPDSTISYQSVVLDGVRQRLILSEPTETGPASMVFYIQGLGCSSVDYGSDPDSPIKLLIDAWAQAGHATARLEKRGMGDSEGDCAELDFETERRGYDAALEQLAASGYARRIFLFGHSLGGIMAPLLNHRDVAGIMVYGTVATPWFDYMMTNFARQDALGGIPDPVIRARQALRDRFQRGLLFEGKSPAELINLIPGAKDLDDVRFAMGQSYYGRHMTFFQQLAAVEPEARWRQVRPPVLALHGEFDWVSAALDHQRIAELSGGQFKSLEHMDHSFLTYPDLETSFVERNSGRFGPEIAWVTLEWMASQEAADTSPPVITDPAD